MELKIESYGPDVGGGEDDNGDGAEPGVTDGDENVARNLGSREVTEREND